jgi:protein-S-isoprenylcysteine O-methyltransferase Ste14
MSDDTARILVPPPLIFLGALVLGLVLDAEAPLGWPQPSTWPAVIAAIVLAGLGVAIIGWQFATFRQVGTPVPTRLPTKALATTGPYRFSRNPDYGATALLYLALALAFGGWWSILALIPTMVIIRYFVISREERYLERKFGEEYRAFKLRVRRWI